MPLIAGTVIGTDGAPVAGAQVLFAHAPVAVPDIAQLTGPDGRFALGAPAAGTYRIAARSGDSAGEVAVEVGESGIKWVEVRIEE